MLWCSWMSGSVCPRMSARNACNACNACTHGHRGTGLWDVGCSYQVQPLIGSYVNPSPLSMQVICMTNDLHR